MLRAVLDVLGRERFRDQLVPLLKSALASPRMREALPNAEVRFLLRQRLPKAESSGGARSLWIDFFRESWKAGAQYTAAELKRDAHLTEKTPLTGGEMELLGVDVASYKLLVGLYAERALPLFGFKIVEAEPPFAKSLSEVRGTPPPHRRTPRNTRTSPFTPRGHCPKSSTRPILPQIEHAPLSTPTALSLHPSPSSRRLQAQLRTIKQLWGHSDVHWPTCRAVIGHVEPTIGLQLAIALFKVRAGGGAGAAAVGAVAVILVGEQ